MTRDGKHAQPCIQCKAMTWRRSGICKRCASVATFDPARFSEEQLVLCVRELARRHEERTELLRAVATYLPERAA